MPGCRWESIEWCENPEKDEYWRGREQGSSAPENKGASAMERAWKTRVLRHGTQHTERSGAAPGRSSTGPDKTTGPENPQQRSE